jgi:hypothetical protein
MHGTYNIKVTTIILSHSLKDDHKVVHLPDEYKLTVKKYIHSAVQKFSD